MKLRTNIHSLSQVSFVPSTTTSKIVGFEKLGVMVGGISNNNGDMAEEFFFSSLAKHPNLGSIHFDDAEKNALKRRKGIKEEFDIILTNGNAIAVVEVKHKVHKNDIEQLERKVNRFKDLYPIYKDYAVYGAMAGMSIPEEIEQEVLKRGYFVLKAQGDHIEVEQEILKPV